MIQGCPVVEDEGRGHSWLTTQIYANIEQLESSVRATYSYTMYGSQLERNVRSAEVECHTHLKSLIFPCWIVSPSWMQGEELGLWQLNMPWCPWEACPFLSECRGGVNWGGQRKEGKEWGERREGKLWSGHKINKWIKFKKKKIKWTNILHRSPNQTQGQTGLRGGSAGL